MSKRSALYDFEPEGRGHRITFDEWRCRVDHGVWKLTERPLEDIADDEILRRFYDAGATPGVMLDAILLSAVECAGGMQ